MIKREIQERIAKRLFKGKAIVIYGARQVGKTTVARSISQSTGVKTLWLNCDELDTREMLRNANSTNLKNLTSGYKIVVIDEAQRVEDIGIAIKIFTDELPDIQVIATGSASFELAQKINEPLTGRKYEFHIYPLSFDEMAEHHGLLEEKRMIDHRLIFGYYPEIVNKQEEEKELLSMLASSYLYKDILTFDRIKKPELVEKLVKALALQVGNEVSYNELSSLVGADKNTVEKYIGILEKAFVIFKLEAYSGNIRNEIKKSRKIYFYDNGILNSVISNYDSIQKRNDKGALWENFVISERKKAFNNAGINYKQNFWRTTQQQEIDLIEETPDGLNAFEIKWNCRNFKLPSTFTSNYDIFENSCIDKNNFDKYILMQKPPNQQP
ncbi:MAG TPA: ATP-binding protein [Ignavibacteria bacterium]|nr:ATP-binding protein [Ignavibacteria bacterium]